jgi:hypothetical protein
MDKIHGYKQILVKTWFLKFEGSLPDISVWGESIHIEQWKNPPVEEYLKI